MIVSGKVLVAEDNPSNQKLISILLQKMGVETVYDAANVDLELASGEGVFITVE